MSNRQSHDDDSRSLLLFPIALLHSHLYWFCSVIWTVCKNFSTEPIEDPTIIPSTTLNVNSNLNHSYRKRSSQPILLSIQDHHQHTSKVIKRPRGFSAPPPPPSTSSVNTRERCTTISAGTPIEPPSSKRKRFYLALRQHQQQQQQSAHSETDEEIIIRPSLSDERTGATCPPQWWQKTRFYIDALKHSSSPNSSVCSLSDAGDVDETSRPPRKSIESVESTAPIRSNTSNTCSSAPAIVVPTAAAGERGPVTVIEKIQRRKRFGLKSLQKISISDPSSPMKQQTKRSTNSVRLLFRKKTTTSV